MTDLFLLKLIAELLEGENPTKDEIKVAKKVLKEMIEENKPTSGMLGVDNYNEPSNLTPEAEQARRELQ